MEDRPTLYYRLILEGIADPDRCALDMECIDAVRAALDEIDRLQERVYALEAEVMKTGGELVIETGKRMAAERRAIPPWTKDKPTEPGWYWLRGYWAYEAPQTVKVMEKQKDWETGRLRWFVTAPVQEFTDRMEGCEWSGPIPDPPDPSGDNVVTAPGQP